MSHDAVCMDVLRQGKCPRKYCRWCGTCTRPPAIKPLAIKGPQQLKEPLPQPRFKTDTAPWLKPKRALVPRAQASSASTCRDVQEKGYCPRKFCRWCGTATLPAGVKNVQKQAFLKTQSAMQPPKTRGGLPEFPDENKVWIGNIPEQCTHKDLLELCSTVATPLRVQMLKGVGRRTAGVVFAEPEDAVVAVETLHEVDLFGQELQVDLWQRKGPKKMDVVKEDDAED
mmetsp:Transcript_7357/g.17552  ORF Transcript_7357/g.17552 Transcript_7357/m.17552 type:complete len:227 (-) Transcript_7357:91-771(-)